MMHHSAFIEFEFAKELGHRPRPALLLLHGFTGSSASWETLAPALGAHFRVFAVDLPGHGRVGHLRDADQYDMPHVVAALTRFVEETIAEPAHVLGYSMGGRTALALAAHAPQLVRRLILESASPGLATPAERAARIAADEALADRIEARGVAAFVDEWESLPLFATQRNLPEDVRRRLRALRLQNNAHGLALSLRRMGTGAQPALWEALRHLTMPVHLLVGEHDAKFVAIARAMAQKIPHAALTIAPSAGHTVHLENPDVWLQVVEASLMRSS